MLDIAKTSSAELLLHFDVPCRGASILGGFFTIKCEMCEIFYIFFFFDICDWYSENHPSFNSSWIVSQETYVKFCQNQLNRFRLLLSTYFKNAAAWKSCSKFKALSLPAYEWAPSQGCIFENFIKIDLKI